MEIPEHYNDKLLKKSWIYRSKEGKPLGIVGRYQGHDDSKEVITFLKKEGVSWKVGIDLKLRKEFDIKRLKKIKSYKGVRHNYNLPVRGQRTKANFRKNRKKSGAKGAKK
mgnify:CR=1 FL=1